MRGRSPIAIQEQQSLIDRWIEPNPHYPGPQEARLVEYGVSVWVLIAYLRLVNDEARVAEYYGSRRGGGSLLPTASIPHRCSDRLERHFRRGIGYPGRPVS